MRNEYDMHATWIKWAREKERERKSGKNQFNLDAYCLIPSCDANTKSITPKMLLAASEIKTGEKERVEGERGRSQKWIVQDGREWEKCREEA